MSHSRTIVEASRRSHTVTLGNQGNLYLDGQLLGRAPEDHFLRQAVEKSSVVSILQLKTADGQSHQVASHSCQHYRDGVLCHQLADTVEINRFPMSYMEVWFIIRQSYMGSPAMSPVLLPQLPMRRNQRRGILTNGRVHIPLQRPRYGEWRQHPDISCLKAVTAANWSLMIEVLEGAFLIGASRLNLVNRQITRLKAERKQQAKLERRRQQFARAQCLQLEGVQVTLVGDNILYAYTKGGMHYAVDSFSYGVALYIFECPQAADEWLNRRVSARIAAAKAVARITHHRGWRAKTQAYVPTSLAAD